MALDYTREYDPGKLIRDTRSTASKFEGFLKNPMQAFATMGFLLCLGYVFYSTVELWCLAAFGIGIWSRIVIRRTGLPLRIPKTANLLDINEPHPVTGKPTPSAGIIYLGNDQDSHEEIWLTDTMARTHMLFMGTTGSGKTEFLISLVSNALIHGSGMIYVDGKADSELYGKIYSMARSRGREDDVLVVNFQTGARDVFGAQPYKMSNTLNPFAVGSSGMLSQLVISLMSSGKGDVWENRAISFVEAIMKPLVFLRERYGLMLDVSMIRDYFELPRLEELTWKLVETYPGLENTLDGMKSYLMNLPTYDRAKYQKQGETCLEQHGYITMQLVRTFNSLADTYGYIMRTQLAEIDFLDVFLNRRILVVLLPALEKSPAELTNLGRIIVASIKATMAVGLGARIEGDWNRVIESKPTRAPSPFMCVLDEYGYYAVEGFAVVPAQARSLGFSAIFAGQDLPAFQKASEKEAESTMANTNTKLCGKMTCTKTYKYFSDVAGMGYYTRTGGYVGDEQTILGDRKYKDGENASIEKFERVTQDNLQKLKAGQWYLFFEGKIIRMKSFYANYSKSGKRNVSELRVNHFVRVARPSIQELELHRKVATEFDDAIKGPNGLGGKLDTYPVRDYILIAEGLQMFATKGLDPLALMLSAVAYGQQIDGEAESPADDLINAYRQDHAGAQIEADVPFNAAAQGQSASGFDYEQGVQQLGTRADARRGRHAQRGTFNGESGDEFPQEGDADLGITEGFANDPLRYRRAVAEVPYDEADKFGGEIDEDRRRIFQQESIEQLSGATVYGFNPDDGDTPETASSGQRDERDRMELEAISRQAEMSERGGRTGRPRKVKPGLLNREQMMHGFASVQELLGDSVSEAAMAASVVAGNMAEATRYAQSRPTGPVTAESFVEVALRVSSALSMLDEGVRQEQSEAEEAAQ